MMKLSEIAKITKGTIIHGDKDKEFYNFTGLSITKAKENTIIFPFKFKGFDRQDRIMVSVKNGCAGFLISSNYVDKDSVIKEAINYNPDICIIEVKSINRALLDIGTYNRNRNLDKPVIAVTGSYGKTTLCNLIARILATEKKIVFDFENPNRNIGSLIALDYFNFDQCDMAVTEVGVAAVGAMQPMARMVQPSIVIINAVGLAHLYEFQSKEKVLEEKMILADYLRDNKLLFVNYDDEYLKKVKKSDKYRLLTYSINEAKDVVENEDGVHFTLKIYGKDTHFDLNLHGLHNVRNAVIAVKIASIYKISYEHIVEAINSFKPVKARFRIYKNEKRDITLIDDTFNSCYESVKYGLETASKMKGKRKIAILGPVCSGLNDDDTGKYHEKIGEIIPGLGYEYVLLYGEYTKHIFKGALKGMPQKNIKRFKELDLFYEVLDKIIADGDLIFVKGTILGAQTYPEIIKNLIKKYDLKPE